MFPVRESPSGVAENARSLQMIGTWIRIQLGSLQCSQDLAVEESLPPHSVFSLYAAHLHNSATGRVCTDSGSLESRGI